MANENTQSKSGRKSYKNAKLHARRDQKRLDAEARQAAYGDLTLKDKLARAKSRRGESKREIARLEKQLAAQKAPAVKQTPLTEAQKSVKAVKRAKDVAQQK